MVIHSLIDKCEKFWLLDISSDPDRLFKREGSPQHQQIMFMVGHSVAYKSASYQSILV